MIIAEKENFIDVTNEWLNNATPNSHEVKDCLNYEHDGVTYDVDGKYVILDYSKKELEVAHFLKETFGGEIYMVPRINKPDGISTPDYLFRNERWDLKEIRGCGKRTIDSSIKIKPAQATNFIIDVTQTKLEIHEIIKQIQKLYYTSGREWINIIILKKDNTLISVFKRN